MSYSVFTIHNVFIVSTRGVRSAAASSEDIFIVHLFLPVVLNFHFFVFVLHYN